MRCNLPLSLSGRPQPALVIVAAADHLGRREGRHRGGLRLEGLLPGGRAEGAQQWDQLGGLLLLL